MKLSAIVLLLFSPLAVADVYMHSPRGTNDRCDERSNNRNNDNRLFNSQNNAAGGYATCGSEMKYYVDTELFIEWTAQHGCGNGDSEKSKPSNPELDQCNIVIQIGCEDVFGKFSQGETRAVKTYPSQKDSKQYVMTNGRSANKIGSSCLETRPLSENCKNHPSLTDPKCDTLNLNDPADLQIFNSETCKCSPRKSQTYGLHEPELTYQKCANRNRNKGLFTADQNVGPKAVNTRQSPNTDRYGFECPEERDYYPYWHPSGWKDIAVQTSDTKRCKYFQDESENVKGRGECINPNDPQDPTFWQFNTESSCTNNPGAAWIVSDPVWPDHKPDCVQANGLRDNHLGMTSAFGGSKPEPGQFSNYKWRIPEDFVPSGSGPLKCVLRLRYNISTSEVGWDYSAAQNGKLTNNPVIKVGDSQSYDPAAVMPLRFAINTAQYGRTFQDRSEPFYILPRPDNLTSAKIHNLNVRGKRGNIAQVRNCVEYDFVPNILNVKQGDYVNFQWCGSDSNDPNNDGQGIRGTDRSNIVPVSFSDANLPLSLKPDSVTAPLSLFNIDDMRSLAWLDQKECFDVVNMTTNQKNNQDDPRSCHFLNGAPTPYYNRLARVEATGTMYYISSRNNNFSNRSQKGVIVSEAAISPGVAAAIAMGTILVVGSAATAFFIWKRKGTLSIKKVFNRSNAF